MADRVLDLEQEVGATTQFQMVKGAEGPDAVDATCQHLSLPMRKHTAPRPSAQQTLDLDVDELRPEDFREGEAPEPPPPKTPGKKSKKVQGSHFHLTPCWKRVKHHPQHPGSRVL